MECMLAADCSHGPTSPAHSWASQSWMQLLILSALLCGFPSPAPTVAPADTPALGAVSPTTWAQHRTGDPLIGGEALTHSDMNPADPHTSGTQPAALAQPRAQAEPALPEALSEALKFNLFILGDLTQRRSVLYGRVAVGGNATLEHCRIGDSMPRATNNRADLVVGGTLVYTNGIVAKGGIVAGRASLTGVGIPHGRLGEGPMIDFASYGPALTQLSTSLGQVSPTGSAEIRVRRNLKKQIVLTGVDERLNIFALTSQDLAATQTLIINVPAKSSVLVNVNGSAAQLQNLGFGLGNVSRQHILYNFYEATELTLNDDRIQGSILAPHAKVRLVAGRVNGTLIGATLTGGGVTWPAPFDGQLPAL